MKRRVVSENRPIIVVPVPFSLPMRDLFGLDTGKLLHGAKVPVRCLNSAGGYKSFIPTAVETNKKYADFGAVIIKGVGHYPMLEKPDEFNRKLREVLEEACAEEVSPPRPARGRGEEPRARRRAATPQGGRLDSVSFLWDIVASKPWLSPRISGGRGGRCDLSIQHCDPKVLRWSGPKHDAELGLPDHPGERSGYGHTDSPEPTSDNALQRLAERPSSAALGTWDPLSLEYRNRPQRPQ